MIIVENVNINVDSSNQFGRRFKALQQVASKMLEKFYSCGDHFITSYLHPLFGANNDSEMFSQMVWISFFYTLSVAVSMALFPAPYGKFCKLEKYILGIIKVTYFH